MTLAGVKLETGAHTEDEFRRMGQRIVDLEGLVSRIFQNNKVKTTSPVSGVSSQGGQVIRSTRQPPVADLPYLWLKITADGDLINIISKDQNGLPLVVNIGKVKSY